METKDRSRLEQKNRNTLDNLFRALERHDVEAVADLHHDDHVTEYPQSGERISGKHDWRKIVENSPGLPNMVEHGFRLGGDLGVGEMVYEYDGRRLCVCAIFELKEGKIKKATEYFAEPFEAPEWRARWVERM